MSQNQNENGVRRLARLAAVQGLYQIFLTGVKPEQVIAQFKADPKIFMNETGDAASLNNIDEPLFVNVINGVVKNRADIEGMISGALDAKLSLERLEPLLRAILAAGVFELHHHGDVAAGVIINDYVDVAHAFFDSKEPGFVNAILDKLSKNLRAT